MSLVNKIVYRPSIKLLEKEEDILKLIADVKESLTSLNPLFKSKTLKETLSIIETEKYDLAKEIERKSVVIEGEYKSPANSNSVDISNAKKIVDTYREKSEGGCRSCQYKKEDFAIWANLGDICTLKNLYIDEQKTRIEKHYENPCKDHNPYFSKTIEQLLENSPVTV